MKLTLIPIVVTLVGCLLIVLSFLWTSNGVAPEPPWSERQALELARASSAYHDLGHREGGVKSHGDDSIELQQAKRRYNELRGELQKAGSRNEFTSRILRWAGIVLAALGTLGIFFVTSRESS